MIFAESETAGRVTIRPPDPCAADGVDKNALCFTTGSSGREVGGHLLFGLPYTGGQLAIFPQFRYWNKLVIGEKPFETLQRDQSGD